MRTFIAIALLYLLHVGISYSADVIPTASGGGYISLGDYHPTEPHSLSEIPEEVRKRLAAHLKLRLGEAYYQRLVFSGGQIINAEELHKINPDSKNYKWEVPAYVINFHFQLPETGLAYLPTYIELRKDGGVITEIKLPAFGQDSSKLELIPFSKALAKVAEQGYSYEKVSARLKYMEEYGSIVWSFEEEIASNDCLSRKQIVVSAHTGEILWRSESSDS